MSVIITEMVRSEVRRYMWSLVDPESRPRVKNGRGRWGWGVCMNVRVSMTYRPLVVQLE